MSRTSTCLQTLTLCLLAHASMAGAQQQPAQPQPIEKPPKLERIEPGSDQPATTIPPRPRTEITNKRAHGQIVEVDVVSGGSHYTMYPNVPAGNAQPGDAESSAIRAPQWTILQFDGNAKRKAESAAEGAAAPAVAPPPPAPAK